MASIDSQKQKSTSRKRGWKSVPFKDNDIFSFKEEGLISFEELIDYNVADFVEPTAKSGPKKRKVGEKSLSEKEPAVLERSRKKKKRKQRTKKGNVSSNQSLSDAKQIDMMTDEETNADSEKVAKEEHGDDQNNMKQSDDKEDVKLKCDMSDWQGLGVPHEILAAISEQGFSKPTPIQTATLPLAIFQHQDIIGAAETGSGKTMAFALPVLTHIMDYKRKRADKISKDVQTTNTLEKPLYALILTPTRELAIQIHRTMKNLTKYVSVNCAAIVGGLSVQKQERTLRKCPEIIIGTPGRLLSIIKDGDPHLQKVDQIKFLVIDEVDRMLEFGHFKEATEILRRLSLGKSKWQTFLFSATLAVPQYHKKWSAKLKSQSGEESVQKLVDKAQVSPKAQIIDLTKKHIAAEQIKQNRVMCTDEEKDLYLFYILLNFTGRILIFVNSINTTRKIANFLTILGKKALQLHAGKQQKQRLKALDRFSANSDSVMVATDVAARGLDIPNVDTIVHYHLPKDPKIYIHRSGRTARAMNVGQSIILEGPGDLKEYRKIFEIMKLTENIPYLEIDTRLLPDIKRRVSLAKKIDKEEHKINKLSTEKKWFQKASKSLDLEIDVDQNPTEKIGKKDNKVLQSLKRELEYLLKQPIVPAGFSGSYITKSGKLETLKF
eukprot:gene31-9633_t